MTHKQHQLFVYRRYKRVSLQRTSDIGSRVNQARSYIGSVALK